MNHLHPDELDLDGPDCTMPDAMPWVALAAAWAGGLALTAGWLARAAWHAARDPEVVRFLTGH